MLNILPEKLSLKNRNLAIILILFVIEQIFFLAIKAGFIWCVDTPSYMAAWEKIKYGQIDVFRTPVYPIFIGFFKTLMGNEWCVAGIIAAQVIIFGISIVALNGISQRLFSRDSVSTFVVGFYALWPGINMYCLKLLTESLTMSIMVFLLYSCCKLYESPVAKWFALSTLWLLLLLFLKPLMLYMVVVIPVVGISWYLSRHRRSAAYLLVGWCLCCMALGGYSSAINKQLGIPVISIVSVFNEMSIAIQSKLIDPQKIDNEAAAAVFAEANTLEAPSSREIRHCMYRIGGVTSMAERYEILSDSKRYNRVEWIKSAFPRFYRTLTCTALSFKRFGIFPFGLLYAVLALYTVNLFHRWRRGRRMEWIGLFMLLSCIGNISVMILGSIDEWSRLFIPATSVMLLISGEVIMTLRPIVKRFIKRQQL